MQPTSARQPVRVVRHQPAAPLRPASPCPFVAGQMHHVQVPPAVQAVRCNVHQAGGSETVERMRRAVEVAQAARLRAEEALARKNCLV